MTRLWCAGGLVAVLVTAGSLASGSDAHAQTTPPPCATDEYQQFNFWIGEWEVRDSTGVLQGTNRIEPIQGGCALQEYWTGASGGTGTSLNMYDFTRRVWHQTWVSNGILLMLEGGIQDGKMVLMGESVGRGGVTVQNRITWTPVTPTLVTQVWETSTDGGPWQTVFDGRYTKS